MQSTLVKEEVKQVGQPIIQSVVNQLEIFIETDELTKYQITEDFPKYSTRSYLLYNLEAEIESYANVLMFSDIEGVIESEDTYVMNMFQMELVLGVKQEWVDGNWKATLRFSDGEIEIKRMGVK